MAIDNYVEKLSRAIEGLQLPPGSKIHVFVRHDGWCRFLRGGHCNCDPMLRIVREGEGIH
jgi:hypothetical protein